MNLLEVHDLFERLAQRNQLPAFLIGIVVGIFCVFWLIRGDRKRTQGLVEELRRQIQALQHENEELESAKIQVSLEKMGVQDRLSHAEELEAVARANFAHIDQALKINQEKSAGLSDECESYKLRFDKTRDKLLENRRKLRVSLRTSESLSKQLDMVDNMDGKMWLKSTSGPIARFLPLSTQRRTPIISLVNLKGGVGKTTMTANLGAALAWEGMRVLLIDLDHQASLTDLCLKSHERDVLARSDRFIDHLIEHGGDLDQLKSRLIELQTGFGGGSISLAPVREEFSNVENKLMTRWACGLTLGEDIRFRLRAALHSPNLRENFDVVLIDCPPRLTTGSINALAASDYVLIPVLLEPTSADAVPRMLGWLKKFQQFVSPDLNVLGVVGNKANSKEGLISRERVVWTGLQAECDRAWPPKVKLFAEVIREHSAHLGPFASIDTRYEHRYRSLVNQIRQEIPHDCLKPSAVHPFVGSSSDGGGN